MVRMRRRDVFGGLGAGAVVAALPRWSSAMSPDEVKRRMAEYRQDALAKFPFKLIAVPGDQALAKWEALKAAGGGTPVVLGADDERGSFRNLLDPLVSPRPINEILQAAATIKFPDDLAKIVRADEEAAQAKMKAELTANPDMALPQIIVIEKDGSHRTLSREETVAEWLREPQEPTIGDWPTASDAGEGLTIAYDVMTGEPFPKVYIGIAPTDDWTAIPAYLRYGGWNACPAAEYHVAAMRAWRDRYGAELVGISFDTINLRVARKPKTRDEALTLAREHHVYCSDLVDQGTGTLGALAAELMAHDWWYFWWD